MKEYLKSSGSSFLPTRFGSMKTATTRHLDSLYWHYAECHNMSNEKTREACHALNEYLSDLPHQENSQVFSLVGTLCAEHERIAFFAGLRLGAQLMMELSEDTGK